MNTVVQTLIALMTPLIAIIAVHIAYQQYRLNKQAEKRESRASKLAVYSRIKRFFNEVDWTNTIKPDTYEAFNDAVAQADFLFPVDVTEWLSEIQGVAAEWFNQKEGIDKYVVEKGCTQQESLEFQEKNPDFFKPASDQMRECIERILSAHEGLRDRFRDYVDLK